MENTGITDTGSTDTSAEPVNLDNATTEEMFELISGKNPDGSNITKKLTKEELLKHAQMGFGAHEKFEQSKQKEAQFKQLAQMLYDPEKVIDVLKHFGHDTDKLFTGALNRQLLENMKTPEEREMEQLRRDAELYRKEMSERQKKHHESLIQQQATQIQTTLMSKIEQALNTTGIKPTARTVAEVGHYIKQLASKPDFDLNSLPVEKIVQHLKKQHQTSISDLFSDLDEDSLLQFLSDGKLRTKLGSVLAKQLTNAGNSATDIPKVTSTQNNTGKKKYISMDESLGGNNRFSR